MVSAALARPISQRGENGSTLLTADPARLFASFLAECSAVGVNATDVEVLRYIALHTIAHLRGSDTARAITATEQKLQNRWYASLAAGKPDYGVYATDYYVAEMWACWMVYSRKYLAGLAKPNMLPPHGIRADLGAVRCVVDLGCGVGLTTAALTQLFPKADVIATNLGGTTQAAIAMRLAKMYHFRVVETVREILQPVDLIFASEYFEHIPDPLDHLADVLQRLQPRAMLVANSFNTRAIGHFNYYRVNGHLAKAEALSRLFNALLRERGYRKVKTKMWNQRPAYWKREG
jgi:SAM-dependent methyltransferase